MAENHPVGFQWVLEARERGAEVIHVDPRFTRTSAMAAVAMRVCCKVTPPQTHAKLQPALLRLSAIISNEKLTAFLELERAVCIRLLSEQI